MQQILPKNTGKDRKKIVFFHVLFLSIRFTGPGRAGKRKKGRDNYTAGTDGMRKRHGCDKLKKGPLQESPAADRFRREKLCRRKKVLLK
jgi:hypothetical protein